MALLDQSLFPTPLLGQDGNFHFHGLFFNFSSNESMVNFSVADFYNILAHSDSKSWLNLEIIVSLIIIYTVMMCCGIFGNGLVIFSVIRNPAIRTARNLFIVNLAVSDLTLCLICIPFTLVKLIMKNWIFGGFLCKVVPGFQGTSVFVSTLTITAIALDRYHVIIYLNRDETKKITIFFIIGVIWVVSILLATPLYVFVEVINVEVLNIVMYKTCVETWPTISARGIYTIAVMIFQYVLPFIIVCTVQVRIGSFLRYQVIQKKEMTKNKQNKRRDGQQRTTLLLLAIGIVFGVSWLPLNILNLLAEFNSKIVKVKNFPIAVAICHIIAMTSACTNPIFYGWLNTNFQKAFLDIFGKCFICCKCCCCCAKRPTVNHEIKRGNNLNTAETPAKDKPAQDENNVPGVLLATYQTGKTPSSLSSTDITAIQSTV